MATETSDRVRAVARDLGYSPDAGARRLGGQRSTTIGLEVDVLGAAIALNPWYATILSELAVSALAHGFTYTLLPAEADPVRWDQSQLAGLAGALIIDPQRGNKWVPHLLENGVRVVCLGRAPDYERTTWFDNDYEQGARDVVGHLAEQGSKNLVMLSGHERRAVSIDSERGFINEAQRRGLRARIVLLDDLNEDCACDTMSTMLAAGDQPDGVLGSIDKVAIGAMAAAADLGFDVPGDIAVVGLGDSILAAAADPPLSSIRSTPQQLADRAISFISELWSHPETEDRHEFLPAELVVRPSSARRS